MQQITVEWEIGLVYARLDVCDGKSAASISKQHRLELLLPRTWGSWSEKRQGQTARVIMSLSNHRRLCCTHSWPLTAPRDVMNRSCSRAPQGKSTTEKKTSSVYGCNEGVHGHHLKGLADCGNICHLLERKVQKIKLKKFILLCLWSRNIRFVFNNSPSIWLSRFPITLYRSVTHLRCWVQQQG